MMALVIATAGAQMVEEKDPFRYFGSCARFEYGDKEGCTTLGRPGAECCKFHVIGIEGQNQKFCLTDEQRKGPKGEILDEGKYLDRDFTYWEWNCFVPPPPPPPPQPKPEPDPEEKGDDEEDGEDGDGECRPMKPEDLPVWHTFDDWAMEWILWTVYLSGEFWLFGLIIGVPLGIMVYSWLAVVAVYNWFEIF